MNGCCCVEASTLVLMADGSQRPIRDLRIGDLVRTETGTAHIRDIIKGREPELVRIGLAQGGNLVATGNHPLFTDKGVKRCSEVVVDDRLRTVTIAALLLHRSTLHCYSAPWQTATP